MVRRPRSSNNSAAVIPRHTRFLETRLHVTGWADRACLLAELRRRREEAQVEIRKQKREETIAKRRNLNAASSGADSDDESGVDSSVSLAGRSARLRPR